MRKPSLPILNLCAGFAVHWNPSLFLDTDEFMPNAIEHSGHPIIISFVMRIYSAGGITGILVVTPHAVKLFKYMPQSGSVSQRAPIIFINLYAKSLTCGFLH